MFSAGQDGSIFIFRITEQIWNKKDGSLKPASMQIEDQPMDNKGNKDYRLKIVDPELADIVLVKKNEMTEWQVRQKQLKYDLALTKKKVEIKLKECKKRFEKQYQEIARQKDLDIRDLNKRFIDLQKQKQLQDRQNFEAMQKMEANHLQQVEEVQTLYEKKLYAQGSDYLSLEQSKLEMKKFYENKIADLKKQNRDRIQTLLQEFKVNLNKVQDEYEETQRTGTNLRIYYEDKLKKLELEQEEEIAMLKLNHIDKKAELEQKWKELEITQENEKKIKDEFERKKNEEKKEMLEAKQLKKKVKEDLKGKIKNINLLEQERQDNMDKLTKREKDLFKYKFKIKDLQKSKHVLTHRTTEMKQSLQPKETQIEAQKEKLLELEEWFERQMKDMNDLGEKKTKKTSKLNQLQLDLIAQKQKTDEKYKIILKFAQDVYKIVQTKDDKAYKHGIMQLNQNYVMSETAYTESGKKKDVEQIEQLDRELRYMERSIATLKINAIKQEERDKNEINKKTSENTQLVQELNLIKFEEKMLKCEILKQDQLIQQLEKELMQKKRALASDINTAKTEATLMLQSHGINPGQLAMNGQELQAIKEGEGAAKSGASLHSQSQGNLFSKKKDNLEDKARIYELLQQLEESNQQILVHKLEIRSLKD